MRLKVAVAGLLLCVAPAWAAAESANAADAKALGRVEAYLAALHSVRARFTQQVMDADGKVVSESEGALSLEKPGKFRWDYTKPKQLIVSDGVSLWLYDPDLEQVSVRRVKEALTETPALLLSGASHVRDGFTVEDGGQHDGLDWVTLKPKLADADFSELRLAFAGSELKRLEFRSKLDQTTRIDFTGTERNVKLDARLFTFVPPPGVDVIGADSSVAGTH